MHYRRILFYPKGEIPSGGFNYSTTLSESVTPTENFTKSTGKTFTDTETLTDNAPSVVRVLPKDVSDTLTLTESFTRAVTKSLTDSVTLTEVFSKIHGFYVSLTDSVTLSENFTTLRLKLLAFAESIPLVEKMWQFLNNVLVEPFMDLYKKQFTNYEEEDLYH